MAPRRRRRTVGDLVAIALDDRRTMFAWVLDDPLMAFFELVTAPDRAPPVDAILKSRVLFRIWVMHSALRDWPVVGHVDPPPSERAARQFAKWDSVAKQWTLFDGERESPILGDAWRDHEPAAVWSATQVVDRLLDSVAGKPNAWLESMREPSP